MTFAIATLAVLAAPRPVSAQPQNSATSDVFRRYAGRVFKVQVVENGSSTKASLGSGFLVTANGHIVTNFHVISNLINTPGRYHAELIDSSGAQVPVTVLAIDVVHDLAVLASPLRDKPFFEISNVSVSQGSRLFSMGHPRDLGLSIVEGTYNGLLAHTLYPRIHLTASINHGMSGGPTIDETGKVVGVNVASAGNQLGFLVPVDRVIALLAPVLTPGAKTPVPSLAQVASQLREHQDFYLKTIFDSTTKTAPFGPYMVVTQPAPFFRCWANVRPKAEQLYEVTDHSCAIDDEIFLDDEQSTGTISLSHVLVTTKNMPALRFFSVYTQFFANDNMYSGSAEYVTNWKCQTRNVQNGGATMRAALCLRRYRKLGELYDVTLKVAALGKANVGLVSTLDVAGVSFENAQQLADRYLRLITWK